MKKVKELMRLLLIVCLFIPSIHVINAEENTNENHFGRNENILEDIVSFENDTIHEKITYIENDDVKTTERITKKDGTFVIKEKVNNQESII